MKIPARQSVHDDDFNSELARLLVIKVDDVEQHFVVSYDAIAGTIVRYCTDDEGQMIIDRDAGEARTETLTGVVTVDLKSVQD